MSQRTAGESARDSVAPSGTTPVLLCRRLAELGSGLDLAGVQRALLEARPELRVAVVPDLCDSPEALAEAAGGGADRAVLGLCSHDRSDQAFDQQARQAGLDPFGIVRVDLGGLCALAHPGALATGRAIVLLAAAAAKARAFAGSGPEHVKPRLGWSQGRVSRRALFRLPPITYQPVASVQAGRCAAEAGCDLCTAVCPRGALAVTNGTLRIDKSACDACGLCVTACPRDAVELPAASLREYEAELEALLAAPGLDPSEPRAILYVCDANRQLIPALAEEGYAYPAGWLPLAVPCTGMLTAGWLLQTLALGAAAAGVMACGTGCSFGEQERVAATVSYCHGIIALLGISRDAVRLAPAPVAGLAEALAVPCEAAAPSGSAAGGTVCLREPLATARALAGLAEAGTVEAAAVLAHEHSPLGDARIDVQGCTGCASCARACPADALASANEEDTLSISFDPNLCTGCGLCAGWCPENVLQVRRVTDLQALRGGRTVLYSDTQARCERCGAAFAPAAMVRRMEQLLNDGNGRRPPSIRRCPSCRGFGAGSLPVAGEQTTANGRGPA